MQVRRDVQGDHPRHEPAAPDSTDDSARAEEGYPKRVERLFREHNDSLLRFLFTWLRSSQEAKEVAQEAYVKLLQLGNPQGISYLQAFLFKTAANLAKDRLKHKGRREHLDPLVFFDSDSVSPPLDQGCSARQELDLIQQAIEELPAKCRMAFLLHKVHELSIEETAERMNLHPRMTRRYVARALAHCQKILDGQGSTPGKGRPK